MELSVIIPAYNESGRLPGFLTRARDYLDAEFHNLYEIVVVDDGSTDGTAVAIERLITTWPCMRLIRHEVNRGKGAAVQTGMLAAHGRLRLFADADGSTPIEEERRLRRPIERGASLAIGSRALKESGGPSSLPGELLGKAEIQWEARLHRYLIGRAFAALIKGILGLTFADTQCGFKMFRGDVALDLFSRLTLQRFIFDVEILYLAEKLGYRVVEVPVNWCDVPGSKVHLVRDSWQMFLGLWQIGRRYGPLSGSGLAPETEPLVKRSKMVEPGDIELGE